MTAPSGLGPEKALHAILATLRPYLNDLVIIGGWVPHLYRRHGPFPAWRSELSLTQELDVLVTRDLPAGDRPSLPDLLVSAGFAPIGDSMTCAVWATSPERGEKVEFLVPHQGTRHDLNKRVAVRGQHGSDTANLGAIALATLDVMQAHTTTLLVPIGRVEHELTTVNLRVPTLGAYCLNKAITFPQRELSSFGEANSKRAKDLLYLRDLVAAGEAVLVHIQRDCTGIQTSGKRGQFLFDRAVMNLENALHPNERIWITRAAAMRVEREPGIDQSVAEADLRGRLTDLIEVLRGALALTLAPSQPRVAPDRS